MHYLLLHRLLSLNLLLVLKIGHFYHLNFCLLRTRFLFYLLCPFFLFRNLFLNNGHHTLLLLLFFHSLHYLLLGNLCLLSRLAWTIFYYSLPILSEVLPNEIENLLGIVRCKWWPYCFSLNLNADKIFFIFSLCIKWEPVVHISGANSPLVSSFCGIFNRNKLDLFKQDGFGSGQGEVILRNSKVSVSDENCVVLIKNIGLHEIEFCWDVL